LIRIRERLNDRLRRIVREDSDQVPVTVVGDVVHRSLLGASGTVRP
jgi:hypothetical protein